VVVQLLLSMISERFGDFRNEKLSPMLAF
jgi:hypothetical protein